jgi:PST family polysaccharide transporter
MDALDSRNARDKSIARAIAWSASAKWFTQLFSWISTIIVARLLSPSNFGLFGMATVYLCFAGIFDQFGIADAVLTLRDLSKRQIAELNSLAVIQGICLFSFSCAIAVPLAHFFKEPRLAMVVIVSSSTFIINAFQVIPSALLKKNLRFKLLALIDTLRQFFQMISVIALAWYGLGYWSLAYSFIVGVCVSTLLTVLARRHSFAIPHFAGLRREIRFSREVLSAGLFWYLYSNGDFLVAGRFLGTQALGDYTVAWNISSTPIEKIGNLITGVTPALFATVQKDKSELRRYFLRITESLSCIVLPASIGLAVLADLLVSVLLGTKWVGVIGPLRLLGIFVAFRSLNTVLPKILTAIGNTEFVMWTTAVSAIVMPISFLVGSRWGTNGIATAWIIMYPIVTAPLYWKTFRQIDLRLHDYLTAVIPAVNASLIMAVLVLGGRLALPLSLPPLFRLMLLVSLGVAAYSGAFWVLYRERVSRLVRAVQIAIPLPAGRPIQANDRS